MCIISITALVFTNNTSLRAAVKSRIRHIRQKFNINIFFTGSYGPYAGSSIRQRKSVKKPYVWPYLRPYVMQCQPLKPAAGEQLEVEQE